MELTIRPRRLRTNRVMEFVAGNQNNQKARLFIPFSYRIKIL